MAFVQITIDSARKPPHFGEVGGVDLLLSVINISVQTVELVNGLPKLKFE
ncbi:MAG: hypothetical protein HY863_14455 [Chloroflexi bacterium]|nr:hypothetical protein [Chloroflexota bacterium]